MTEFRAPEVDDFNGKIIAEFRANGGSVGGPFHGSDILLLHHTGARSGAERVTPLAYQWVGDQWVGDSFAVFAVRAGSPENPAWFHNLLAHPETVAEVGTRTVRVRARAAQPAERDVIYSRQKQRHPAFAQYEVKAAPRRIPVVVLDPVK
jgi:deazaflavin-dependent oxidoreductase (nitroreductase family)